MTLPTPLELKQKIQDSLREGEIIDVNFIENIFSGHVTEACQVLKDYMISLLSKDAQSEYLSSEPIAEFVLFTGGGKIFAPYYGWQFKPNFIARVGDKLYLNDPDHPYFTGKEISARDNIGKDRVGDGQPPIEINTNLENESVEDNLNKISDEVKTNISNNDRAFRNKQTGEIISVLTGNKKQIDDEEHLWESVIVFSDIPNQQIDLILEDSRKTLMLLNNSAVALDIAYDFLKKNYSEEELSTTIPLCEIPITMKDLKPFRVNEGE